MGNKANDYEINCLAMSIVNHTNEVNKVNVETRQDNNDKCFDYAVDKIKEFIEQGYIVGIDLAKGKDMTTYSPPYK